MVGACSHMATAPVYSNVHDNPRRVSAEDIEHEPNPEPFVSLCVTTRTKISESGHVVRRERQPAALLVWLRFVAY
jgi:hypothetical protein